MSDARIRELERAVAQGDPAAALPLARENLRAGRLLAALEGVACVADAPLDLLELEQAAWREVLARLQPDPARAVPSFPATWGTAQLVGFCGGAAVLQLLRLEGGLALGVHTAVVDLAAREVVVRPDGSGERLEPVAATALGVVCRRVHGQGATLLSRADGWTPVQHELDGLLLGADPGGDHVVTHVRGAYRIVRRVGGSVVREVRPEASDVLGVPVWSWRHDRVAWMAERSRIRAATLTTSAPAWEVPAPGDQARCRAIVEDGRLLTAPPLALVDLDGGRALAPAPAVSGADAGFLARATMSWDGADLLGDAGELGLVRVPLGGGRRARPPRLLAPPVRGRGAGVGPLWHPRADVAVARAGGRVAATLATPEGAVLHLPAGARALGWTPDGAALLVARAMQLEVWTARDP